MGKLSLLLFTIGILFIVSGFTIQLDDGCKKGTEIRIVPRNVYDQIIQDSIL